MVGDKNPSSSSDIKILLQPKNLVKTVSSALPVASAISEMLGQLESERIEQRISALEQERKLHQLELANPPATSSFIQDWPYAAAEYRPRIVDLAVSYDGGIEDASQRGRRLILPVAHACIYNKEILVTCAEAIDLLLNVAQHKQGAPVFLSNLDQYSLEIAEPDRLSGIAVCSVGARDEAVRKRVEESMAQHGIPKLIDGLPESDLKFTVTPWIAQEIGFFHSGEAEDVMRDFEYSTLQFETSVISHFRKLSEEGLKVFVSTVLGGRLVRCGSPVFSRNGTLLGIISDTESYKSDAGRRAVVRSLLGHPRFTKFEKKT